MNSRFSFRWPLFAVAWVTGPILVSLICVIHGAWHDATLVRQGVFRTTLEPSRTQASRRAGALETQLEKAALPIDWGAWRTDAEQIAFWQRLCEPITKTAHLAVIDAAGTVVLHNDPRFWNIPLDREWYDRKVPHAGQDVVLAETGLMGTSGPVYDLSVPLFVRGAEIGVLHQGVDANAFDEIVAEQQRYLYTKWAFIIVGTLVIDLIAIGAMTFLFRQGRELQEMVTNSVREQARTISQIGGGLAHQIRNPLHALRLNLHILRRSQGGSNRLTQEQLEAAFRESDAVIDVVEGLMRDLLQFSSPGPGQTSDVELGQATLAGYHLLKEEFQRRRIEVKLDITVEPLSIAIDPAHIRQVIGNLMTFVVNNTPANGQAEISVLRRGDMAEFVVGHSGPSFTKQQSASIFQPFQSPHESESGLELALVRCLAIEAGGTVVCEKRAPSGNRFRVSLPLAKA